MLRVAQKIEPRVLGGVAKDLLGRALAFRKPAMDVGLAEVDARVRIALGANARMMVEPKGIEPSTA